MADLLRLCTAGSVDDGKSTLIGRLLHDTGTLPDDHVAAVAAASRGRTAGPLDFSLFTDGLKAEREQGITIDVAYRYFSTARRHYILADTPGHEQYTRNMATGASTADAAILLADAERGLTPQSFLHAEIVRLLGVPHVTLAVNKMDRVGFTERPFRTLVNEFVEHVTGIAVQAVPVSALEGDNLTRPSTRMPWYRGPDLLTWLDGLPAGDGGAPGDFRLPVQLVLRGGQRRAYAGRIASGRISVGDRVRVFAGDHSAIVTTIRSAGVDVTTAAAGESVAVSLDRELDAGRGALIATGAPHVTTAFEADVVWMDEQPLVAERPYRLKHAAATTTVRADRALRLNEVGRVAFRTTTPLAFDTYSTSRRMGAFILVDPATHGTAGAGMIRASGTSSPRSGGVEGGLDASRLDASWLDASRLAHAARSAASLDEATATVQSILDEYTDAIR